MKHYDDSDFGTDCYIKSHWYELPEPKCVIHVVNVSGWCENGIETTTFTYVDDSMPDEVKNWFNDN